MWNIIISVFHIYTSSRTVFVKYSQADHRSIARSDLLGSSCSGRPRSNGHHCNKNTNPLSVVALNKTGPGFLHRKGEWKRFDPKGIHRRGTRLYKCMEPMENVWYGYCQVQSVRREMVCAYFTVQVKWLMFMWGKKAFRKLNCEECSSEDDAACFDFVSVLGRAAVPVSVKIMTHDTHTYSPGCVCKVLQLWFLGRSMWQNQCVCVYLMVSLMT